MLLTILGAAVLNSSQTPYIDPQITGAERELMTAVLSSYPSDFTDKVFYADLDGAVHVNYLSSTSEVFTAVPSSTQGLFENLLGDVFAPSNVPDSQIREPEPAEDGSDQAQGNHEGSPPMAPSPFPGTGPYRRVFLDPAYMNFIDVRGILSSSLHPLLTGAGAGDTAYTYLSPWSLTNSNYYSGGDFGLQFSHLRRVWDPYCLVGGVPQYCAPKHPAGCGIQDDDAGPEGRLLRFGVTYADRLLRPMHVWLSNVGLHMDRRACKQPQLERNRALLRQGGQYCPTTARGYAWIVPSRAQLDILESSHYQPAVQLEFVPCSSFAPEVSQPRIGFMAENAHCHDGWRC